MKFENDAYTNNISIIHKIADDISLKSYLHNLMIRLENKKLLNITALMVGFALIGNIKENDTDSILQRRKHCRDCSNYLKSFNYLPIYEISDWTSQWKYMIKIEENKCIKTHLKRELKELENIE
jgi:hypothetical protein